DIQKAQEGEHGVLLLRPGCGIAVDIKGTQQNKQGDRKNTGAQQKFLPSFRIKSFAIPHSQRVTQEQDSEPGKKRVGDHGGHSGRQLAKTRLMNETPEVRVRRVW